MPGRARNGPRGPAPMYQQLLLFPERAEILGEGRFESYKISIEHWRSLAEVFRDAFETVYMRRSARVLLVHGGQAHGKSLFVLTLEQDFKASVDPVAPDPDNLWHVLSGGDPIDLAKVREARVTTQLRRVAPGAGWLADERAFARADKTEGVRVFLFDDVHKDVFIREWADLTAPDYARLRAEGHRRGALESVAQKLVEDCRGDFRRSIFVLLSNDVELLNELRVELDKSWAGLAHRVELALPPPELKEEIVRTNTNRLNRQSYWFCLDQGGPDEKKDAYDTLRGDRGFQNAFEVISRALAAQQRAKRTGRQANKNILTLVTLGTTPADVGSFLGDHDLVPDESTPGEHVGAWWLRDRWASALNVPSREDPAYADYSRRASLVESEFSLRWVALDVVATWVLCTSAVGDSLAARLVKLLEDAPSIAEARKQAKTIRERAIADLDAELGARSAAPELAEFVARFTNATGQARSWIYEKPIADHLRRALSQGLRVRGNLRPDVILAEYEPCAVTSATSGSDKAIEIAIKRGCHVIEMTAHLQPDMRGLDAYLAQKVNAYAELLESV